MFEHIEAVVAHEYFHNWTGNRITCRDWFQLCLKEGLTVFRDQEFSADERSATVQRIADVRQLRTQQFAEDAGPLAHPVRPETYIEINNFYTATVYEKGAEVVRMIQTILGPALFRRGMDLYFERHDGQAATVEEFWRASPRCPGATSRSSSSGTARRARRSSSARWRTTGREGRRAARSRCCRARPRHPPGADAHPLRLGLLGANGQDIQLKLADGALADDVVHVTRPSEVFRFVDVPSRPVPSCCAASRRRSTSRSISPTATSSS